LPLAFVDYCLLVTQLITAAIHYYVAAAMPLLYAPLRRRFADAAMLMRIAAAATLIARCR